MKRKYNSKGMTKGFKHLRLNSSLDGITDFNEFTAQLGEIQPPLGKSDSVPLTLKELNPPIPGMNLLLWANFYPDSLMFCNPFWIH